VANEPKGCWVEWTESGCPVRVTLSPEIADGWLKQGMIVVWMSEAHRA
jgi:hypothetical protein